MISVDPASEATPPVDPQIVAAAMEAAGCYRDFPPQWIGFAQCGLHGTPWEDDQCGEVALIVRTVFPLIHNAAIEAAAEQFRDLDRIHPACDGPQVVYAYEVAERLAALKIGDTNKLKGRT